MSSQVARYDLNRVKGLAQGYLNGKLDSINFTAPRRSTEQVVQVLSCSNEVANQTIARGLLLLQEKDFHARVLQWNEVYDVYGLENYEEHNWYVKFCVVADGIQYIEEVSFHPLEKEMIFFDGRKMPVKHGAI
jgi:hypothetical protein